MRKDRSARLAVLRRAGSVAMALVLAGCGQTIPTAAPTGSPASSGPGSFPGPSASTAPAPSAVATGATTAGPLTAREFAVPAGSRPHDVSPAVDGGVWFTGQGDGTLGHLDPDTGNVRQISLGGGSAPHGVITGPDGAPWITDSGLNAILRVDPKTEAVRAFRLPADRGGANLNTATFDRSGILWFTGQAGVYGRLTPATGALDVFDAPKGRGPYGITATPDGSVWFASLAGSFIGRIDSRTGAARVHEPPTAEQGARRVWSDADGKVWVSEWNAGQVGVFDPVAGTWREWRLPGPNPMAYAVFVDDLGSVWLTDFGANAIVRFDPVTERFDVLRLPSRAAEVRQLHGRPGEVWGAESATDKLVVVATR